MKPNYIKDSKQVKAERVERLSRTIRIQRDRLLTDTDWVVVKHNELGTSVPQEWLNYRQALRDITEQTDFPEKIKWPQKPEQ